MGDMKAFLERVLYTAGEIATTYSHRKTPPAETTRDQLSGFKCSGTLEEMQRFVGGMHTRYVDRDEDEGTVTFDHTVSVTYRGDGRTMMYTALVKLSKEEDGQWKASFSYRKGELVLKWKTLSNEALNSFVQFNL
jgi:hypothetical protein